MFVSRWDAAGVDGSSSTQDGQGPPKARPAWKSGGFWHARHNRTGMPVFCSLGVGARLQRDFTLLADRGPANHLGALIVTPAAPAP
jgi:hypothetical protein